MGQLTVDVEEKGVMYIKKGGVITMECREALSRLVATHGTSFASAYKILVTSWDCAAESTGMQVRGALTSEEADVEAAVSSVAMSGRQTQFVHAWEMAAVVSGDEREMSGSGLTWREGERQHDVEEEGFMFEEMSQDRDRDEQENVVPEAVVDTVLKEEVVDERSVSVDTDSGGVLDVRVSQDPEDVMNDFEKIEPSDRKGRFVALTFDGTSTWWGRSFVSMTVCFKLGGLRKSKMSTLIEKIDKTSECGALGYVELILGWVDDVRSLQRRLGEKDEHLLNIYDVGVFMVDNCPENVGANGGVCYLLEERRALAYVELQESDVRGSALGAYVKSKIVHCGLHVVNTFSSNYNARWKESDLDFVREYRATAAAGERVGVCEEDGPHNVSESYDTAMYGFHDDEPPVTQGGGSAVDTKKGIWWELNSGKSKLESKAMTYARWAYKTLSTCHVYREFLSRQGVTQEWQRTMTSRWGSREAIMYHILLNEVITADFYAECRLGEYSPETAERHSQCPFSWWCTGPNYEILF